MDAISARDIGLSRHDEESSGCIGSRLATNDPTITTSSRTVLHHTHDQSPLSDVAYAFPTFESTPRFYDERDALECAAAAATRELADDRPRSGQPAVLSLTTSRLALAPPWRRPMPASPDAALDQLAALHVAALAIAETTFAEMHDRIAAICRRHPTWAPLFEEFAEVLQIQLSTALLTLVETQAAGPIDAGRLGDQQNGG